ncbi:MAG: hypothetical protein H7Y00_03520 [Fimbriimonadaceae bacterium]|nr:hypothetical protein [Chitinophagales bacterium]
MLVPNMTLHEIRNAVINDYVQEIKNKLELIKITYPGKLMRNGYKDIVETITFNAKSRNNWRITIVCKKGKLSSTPYLVAYDNIGITASHIPYFYNPYRFMHFNSHFFKRYRERAKIKIEKPEDLVKYFFRKNFFLIPCYVPREDGTQQLFTPLADGVALGNYHPGSEIYEFKTFVDFSLLREDQKKQGAEILTDTIKDVENEMKRRLKIQ